MFDIGGVELGVLALAFALGGLTKGVSGMGLPLVAVPILAQVFPVPTAVALMTGPTVVSNLWQMVQGAYLRAVLRRFWPALLALVPGTVLGAQGLAVLDDRVLALVLGVMVVGFVVFSLASPRAQLAPRHERWAGLAAGFGAGLIGGLSSFFGPPLVVYLMALRLPKDLFVAAVSVFFLIGQLLLSLFLAGADILGWRELTLSAIALLPMTAALLAGQALRNRIPQEAFRRGLLLVLLLIGLNLCRQGLGIG